MPDSVNTDLVNKLLIDIRNQIYKEIYNTSYEIDNQIDRLALTAMYLKPNLKDDEILELRDKLATRKSIERFHFKELLKKKELI